MRKKKGNINPEIAAFRNGKDIRFNNFRISNSAGIHLLCCVNKYRMKDQYSGYDENYFDITFSGKIQQLMIENYNKFPFNNGFIQ
jgi:hypothetical protein